MITTKQAVYAEIIRHEAEDLWRMGFAFTIGIEGQPELMCLHRMNLVGENYIESCLDSLADERGIPKEYFRFFIKENRLDAPVARPAPQACRIESKSYTGRNTICIMIIVALIMFVCRFAPV
ncbi:MAG TPA: hypothetical protein VHF05_03015 [Candidatus Paceibacterota bacterium]|jgi:hypothetical protein|nr:hypothetical protein [Candidatus Paceibacterota bacterium]